MYYLTLLTPWTVQSACLGSNSTLPSVASCVMLAKLFDLSEPEFPLLKMEEISMPASSGCFHSQHDKNSSHYYCCSYSISTTTTISIITRFLLAFFAVN